MFSLNWVRKYRPSLRYTESCHNLLIQPPLSLPAAGNVSRVEASVIYPLKLHTDDVNKCLHYKSGSHGVPDLILYEFMFLLVYYR